MKKAKKIILALLLGMILLLTACQTKMVEVTDHKTGLVFTNRYMDSLKGITATDYEGYWMAEKILWFEFSGKDQGYRGIIYIDEKEAERLMNDYNDWYYDSSALPYMKDVDMSPVAGSDWYGSNQFVGEFSTMLRINDLRFNGKDVIVFDVHTSMLQR